MLLEALLCDFALLAFPHKINTGGCDVKLSESSHFAHLLPKSLGVSPLPIPPLVGDYMGTVIGVVYMQSRRYSLTSYLDHVH